MPGIVEAAAINPIKSDGVPKLTAKGLRTGLLDIVELRIARAPITQSTIKEVPPAKYTFFKFKS
jgi:hypothetical protein